VVASQPRKEEGRTSREKSKPFLERERRRDRIFEENERKMREKGIYTLHQVRSGTC